MLQLARAGGTVPGGNANNVNNKEGSHKAVHVKQKSSKSDPIDLD